MKKLGVAFGGVPFAILPNGRMAIGFHCKTINAPAPGTPDGVSLGRSNRPDVLRPSPFQLQRVSKDDQSLMPREECMGRPVNSLVAIDGVQDFKPRRISEYDPGKTIPLCINADKTGPRTEEAMPYEVDSLAKAKSVYADGAFVTVEIGDGKAYIENKEIPLDILKAWANGDDSIPGGNRDSDFFYNGKAINMVVPAANLVLFLIKS